MDGRTLALHSRSLVLAPALLLLLGHGLQLGERLGEWHETIRSRSLPNGIYHPYTCHPNPCTCHISTNEPPALSSDLCLAVLSPLGTRRLVLLLLLPLALLIPEVKDTSIV